ncbi:MAG TPA: hypothetical protein VMW83_15245 [Spirochaetia bacterium]|nr:hypothetical protein [Spirochaetia bacterium]
MTDFKAMFLKEWQELFNIPKPGPGFLWALMATPLGRLLILVAMLIITVGAMGDSFLANAGTLGLVFLIPFLFVSTIVVDSFAGERERGTLDTLLASRLPEWAIFFGKVGAPIVAATLAMLAASLGSWILALFMFGSRAAAVFPPSFLGAIPFSTLLVGVLGAGVSALVSERSASVRNAQQGVTYGALGVSLVIALPINSLPASVRQHLLAMLLSLSPGLTTAVLLTVLIGLDALLLYIALRRFVRLRLFDR